MASRRSWLIGAGRERSRGLAGALAFAAAVAFASRAQAQPDVSTNPDTVVLTDGGRIRGHVMEDDESGVSVILVDGTTNRVPRSRVSKVQYHGTPEAAHAAPAPPASAGPTAPAAGAVSSAPLASPAPLPALPDPGQYRGGGQHLTALWVTGLAVFSVAYLVGIPITAATDQTDTHSKSVAEVSVPLVGPFLLLGDSANSLTGAETAGLVASAILQNAGVAMFIIGATARVGGSDSAVALVPSGVGSGTGMTLRGTF